jgi:hypothetical protein
MPDFTQEHQGDSDCSEDRGTIEMPATPGDPPPIISYATPKPFDLPTAAWREGNLVVVPIGSDLPPRCVKCNGPAAPKYTRRSKLTWFHPAYYFILLPCLTLILALPMLLIYSVVITVVGKRIWVAVGLCKRHGWRVRRRKIAGVLMGVLGMSILIGILVAERQYQVHWSAQLVSAIAVIGAVLFLASLLLETLTMHVLQPARIDKSYAYLKGASPEFLESLGASAEARVVDLH